MHELPIMREILHIVNKNSNLSDTRRLVSVTLQVGEIRDLQGHFVQMYWKYITQGTPAEGSQVIIEVIPTTAKCLQCGAEYRVNIMETEQLCCPQCGHDKANQLTGNELLIDEVEIRTVKEKEDQP